jgi:hypothetical protein
MEKPEQIEFFWSFPGLLWSITSFLCMASVQPVVIIVVLAFSGYDGRQLVFSGA